MYSNYCYVNRIPESQLGQFRAAIRSLSSSTAHTESLQGHIKADVLAPILSECERLSPEEWQKLYTLSAQQLSDLNASQASSNQPLLSPGEFLDTNSLHLIRDSYLTWVERYKVYFALKQELRSLKIDYPLKLQAFLRFASFGSFLTYKLALGRVKKYFKVKVNQANIDKHYISEALNISRSYFSMSTSTSVESHNDFL
ncbi:hypothetical protein Taro_049597 [Colocasia esculenta]|uniref:Uncharacterized protein n=1 Tax=Colocasia esculenta TaxID=4460 RepID=A0A843XBJ0_COLES|nr:hypothetical protein [Colocasia esculenta]